MMNLSSYFQKVKNFLKISTFTITLLFCLFITQNTQAQTISGTGTSNNICGDCNPTGWQEANANLDGTPDISDRIRAGGFGTIGAGAQWTIDGVNAAALPLPPTNQTNNRWITLRDVGPSGNFEENVTANMEGLVVNTTYKLVFHIMTARTLANGDADFVLQDITDAIPNQPTGGNQPYAGVYIEEFDIQIGSNDRRTINVPVEAQNQWLTVSLIFVAQNTTEAITIFPGADSGYDGNVNNYNLLEVIHFAVDSVNALEILDTDGDGIADDDDIDDDNDGILDITESGGFAPNADEDGDGIPNYLDVFDNTAGDGNQGFTNYSDANSDGLPDAYDFDGDGIPNHLDLDSDNDGILDNVEFQTSAGYTAPSGSVGANGYYDNYETAVDSGTPLNNPQNTDGTFGADYLDIDSDNDGIPDNVEAQTTLGYIAPTGNVGKNGVYTAYENVDTYTPTGITIRDTDLDGTPDYRDTDSDADGTTDINENGEGNVLSGSDNDGDGLDNNFDADNVNYDVNDNIDTPSTDLPDVDSDVNSGGNVDYRDAVTGLDSDGDGIPDLVDIDDDDDGILDVNECSIAVFPAGGPNAITLDVGVSRETEILDGVTGGQQGARFNNTADVLVLQLRAANAIVPAGTVITITTTASNNTAKRLLFQQSDAAGNNTSNNWDVSYNSTQNPTPNQNFTGFGNTQFIVNYTLATDATHIRIGMTERVSSRINIDYLEYASFNICSPVDTDGDGITDDLDIDSDNDGIPDNYEAQSTAGYTPKSGVDSDGDGLDDAYDDDLGGAANSDGINPSEWINTDGALTNSDTIPDYLDIDSDNDGIPDNIEAQSTIGYMAPNGVPGANGLDNAYDFTDSYASTGLATTLINTDGDAQPDYRDVDSDGDGTNDDAEGRTGTPAFVGVDADGDGLDDGYDNVDTTGGLFDVNDNINDPEVAGLIDVDTDVSTGGDVDYRDTLVGQDTDGDGIVDSIDIDDDNDGILDTLENTCDNPTVQFDATPQAYWSLDNNTNDVSGNGNNERIGVGTAPAFSTTAIQGTHSANFNGTTDLIRYSQDGGFMEATYSNISFSAWILPSSLTGDRIIYEEGGGTNGVTLWLNNNTLTVSARSGGAGTQTNVTHQTTLSLDSEWHHVAYTFAAGDLTVYLDGVPSATTTAAFITIPSHGDDGGLGGLIGGTSSAGISGFYEGLLDAARYTSLEAWSATRIAFEATTVCDFDGDGIQNSLDQDSDGDGILDIIESQSTTNPITISGLDADNDGLDDNFDATPSSGASGSNGTATPVNTDVATETVITPDYLDIDSDNDGIPDNVEAQTTTGYTAPTGNVGLNGVDEAYENNDTFTATGLDPVDTDGTEDDDYRDTDADGDTILDENESGITPNGGFGDADGDGLLDTWEGSDATSGESYDVNDEIDDPVNDLLDADGDGGSTGDVDYRDDSIFIDTDGDGVGNEDDIDDDNDGILDINEDALADADGDGIPNSLDIDSDDDGIPDNIEAQLTIGYIAPSGIGIGITDNDGDGLDDNYDANTNDISTAASIGLIAVNTDNITGNNTDVNPDYVDTDSDGDGTFDILENGNANALLGTDTDGDGYDDAFEGVLNDQDVNDDINDPATDLPDLDSDVNTADGTQPDAAEYNDVDYRDIDDDRAPPSVLGNILWLRADIGVTGVGEVSNWADQSGSLFNATNTGTGPAKLGDGIAFDGLNFNPTLQFTEASNHDLEIAGGGIFGNGVINNDVWIYAVSESNSATNASFIFGNAVTGGTVEFQAPTTGSLLSLNNGTGTTLTSAWGGTANVFNLWNGGSSSSTATPSGTNKAIYRDGLQIATNNTGNGVTFTSNNSSSFIGSDENGANFFNGQIAEIMVFNTVPTSIEQQQIQSYLAIKYGITLDQTDNDATIDEGDYVIGGTPDIIVWDETANSTYHNDVAGIGRDDGKFLNQKQSKSINTSSLVTIGLGSIAANNGSNSNTISGDGSFLMWGHNGSVANNTNTSSVTLLCESELQLDRVWKIVETGTIGAVEIAAVQSTIDAALTTPTSEVIVLKIADDSGFTTNVKHIPVTTRSINGVAHYVADYNFNGTKYFTYSEVLGIFWNGDTATWTGGAGTNGAPSTDLINGIDGGKVLVIDAEASLTNAIMTESANVACLWVKENSKLVVGSDLFIEFNEDFILDGEIRLINDAQLVQSHTGLSNVQGNGVIYRDQAATVPSVYRYHYWSSPVTAALGNTNYSTSTVMFDGTTPTSENSVAQAINWQDYNFTVASLNGKTTNPITIATWWIYSYFNGTTRDNWSQRLSTGNINIAEGFIMKSTGRSPQNFTFVGSPNDGTYTKVIGPGTNSLLGNPYPSAIDTQQFIDDNDDVIEGTLYFWEHQGESTTTSQVEGHGRFGYIGGYSVRNLAMGVAANSVVDGTAGLGEGTYNAPPQFIAVGQGFFLGTSTGGTITFENSQRAGSTDNIFFRGEQDVTEDLPNFKIGMDYTNNSNAEIHRQLGINFKEGNSFDYDNSFDSSLFDRQPTDIYWDFEEIEANLIIAGVGGLSTDLQIPLGINIDVNSPISIMIDETEKMDGYEIYLGDLVTGRIFNLENPVQLDLPIGEYIDRFVLLFGGTSLSNDDNPLFQDFNVYMNNTTDEIIIRNNNNTAIKKVELFNILGQPIKTWANLDNSIEQRLQVLAPTAIYIVKITTDKGEITKKVIID